MCSAPVLILFNFLLHPLLSTATTSLLFCYSHSLFRSSSYPMACCCCCFHWQHFLICLWKCAASHLFTLYFFCLPLLAFVPRVSFLLFRVSDSFNISLHQFSGKHSASCSSCACLIVPSFQFHISCLTFNLS